MADFTSAITRKQSEVQAQIKNGTFNSSAASQNDNKSLFVEMYKEMNKFKEIVERLSAETSKYIQLYELNYMPEVRDLTSLRARIIDKIEKGFIV